MHKVYKNLYKPIRIVGLPIRFFSVVLMLEGIVFFVLRKPFIALVIFIFTLITAFILKKESEITTIFTFLLKTDEKR